MKKSDLKTGMRVRTRDGQIYLVVCDVLINGAKDILFSSKYGWMNGVFYNDNLTSEDYDEGCFDIMEVYSIDKDQNNFTYGFMDLDRRFSIWKRQECTEEHKKRINALKVLGFNYVAIDKNGEMFAYVSKPEKEPKYNHWDVVSYEDFYELTNKNKEAFNFIKWEDKEPFEIPTL